MPRFRVPRFDFLNTRVARRLFALFLLGVIVPVLLLGGISFLVVSGQLREQSEDRVGAMADNAAQAMFERLSQVDRELGQLASVVDAGLILAGEAREDALEGTTVEPLLRNLNAVSVADAHGSHPVFGDLSTFPPVSPEDLVFVSDSAGGGQAVLKTLRGPDGERELFLVRALRPGDESRGLIWGRMIPDSLWSSAVQYSALPTRASFCVLDELDAPLFCEGDSTAGMVDGFLRAGDRGVNGTFQWASTDEGFFAGFNQVYLRAAYRAPNWFAVVSEAESLVFEPLDRFQQTLPAALLLGVVVVGLLTNYQVRRTMKPLEQLVEGTRRVSERNFSQTVKVEGDDEFGVLGDSFNLMADELGLRFRQLEAGRAIDRAALTGEEQTEVVGTLVSTFGTILDFDRMVVFLTDTNDPGRVTIWWTEGAGAGDHAGRISDEDVARLMAVGEPFQVTEQEAMPDFLRHGRFGAAMLPALVLPIIAQGELEGIVAMGRLDQSGFSEDEVDRCRYVVDQAAVAFNTVRLITRLQEMSWGTLGALARAIDAKSQWTAGHSERVTRLSVQMGRTLGLEEHDLDTLHRGGLLHDLGKIGIAGEILDSPGALSPEQRQIMEEHPTIGARILEPVPAFRRMIPIVLQHHERLDGNGYPQGLSADEIDPLAKVLAVADTFDAMVSPRPYRPALQQSFVMQWIQSQAGTGFDIAAVMALSQVLEAGWVHEIPDDAGVTVRV